MKKRLKSGVLAVLLAAVLILLAENGAAHCNGRRLKAALEDIRTDTVLLNQVVPFDWDAVYTFSPYTPVEEMEAAMGLQSRLLRQTVSENMVQLIFVRGNRVVCNVQGYPDALGYQIRLSRWGSRGAVLTCRENARFSVSRSGGVVELVQIE